MPFFSLSPPPRVQPSFSQAGLRPSLQPSSKASLSLAAHSFPERALRKRYTWACPVQEQRQEAPKAKTSPSTQSQDASARAQKATPGRLPAPGLRLPLAVVAALVCHIRRLLALCHRPHCSLEAGTRASGAPSLPPLQAPTRRLTRRGRRRVGAAPPLGPAAAHRVRHPAVVVPISRPARAQPAMPAAQRRNLALQKANSHFSLQAILKSDGLSTPATVLFLSVVPGDPVLFLPGAGVENRRNRLNVAVYPPKCSRTSSTFSVKTLAWTSKIKPRISSRVSTGIGGITRRSRPQIRLGSLRIGEQ
jgi:hypothetical protein